MPRLQKHFKKMFAGIHSVILSEDQSQVLGISAKEGEQVLYICCIQIYLCICTAYFEVLSLLLLFVLLVVVFLLLCNI